MPLRMSSLIRPVSLLLLTLLIPGCSGNSGPTLHPVKGTLTVGGKPLSKVGVSFTPIEAGISSAGRTNDAGEFVLVSQNGRAGAVAGFHTVVLTADASASETGNASDPDVQKRMMAERNAAITAGKRGAPSMAGVKAPFPPEYGSASSPLKYEVKSGDNFFEIPIP